MIHQHLKDEVYQDELKHALYTTFSIDKFLAWRLFIGQWLDPGETVDVYLANLRKLLVGSVHGQILGYTFSEELSDDVCWVLQASSQPDEIGNDQLLVKVCTILKETEHVSAAARVDRMFSLSIYKVFCLDVAQGCMNGVPMKV